MKTSPRIRSLICAVLCAAMLCGTCLPAAFAESASPYHLEGWERLPGSDAATEIYAAAGMRLYIRTQESTATPGRLYDLCAALVDGLGYTGGVTGAATDGWRYAGEKEDGGVLAGCGAADGGSVRFLFILAEPGVGTDRAGQALDLVLNGPQADPVPETFRVVQPDRAPFRFALRGAVLDWGADLEALRAAEPDVEYDDSDETAACFVRFLPEEGVAVRWFLLHPDHPDWLCAVEIAGGASAAEQLADLSARFGAPDEADEGAWRWNAAEGTYLMLREEGERAVMRCGTDRLPAE